MLLLTSFCSVDYFLGLLGLAFHPNYSTNGYFYIFYSFSEDGDEFQRVSRMSVSATDPNEADPSSEVPLITQLDEASTVNHAVGKSRLSTN